MLNLALGTLIGLVHDESWHKNYKNLGPSKFSFIKLNVPAKGLGGVRTYALIALLGSLAGILSVFNYTIFAYIIFIIFGCFVLISYFLNYFDKNTFGLTTELSIISVFILSFLNSATDIQIKIIVSLSVFIAFIVSLKKELRGFIAHFSRHEIVDIIKFVLTTIVVLPFLPNKDLFVYQIPYIKNFFITNFGSDSILYAIPAFNIMKLWLIVVLIETINFSGYFLIKILGDRLGFALTGFLGGLISSTAVTETMAERSKAIKKKQSKILLINSTILANLTSFIRVSLIAFVLNFRFGLKIFVPMCAMSCYLIFWVLLHSFKLKKTRKDNQELNMLVNFDSPFAFKPAIKFATLFISVSVITHIALFLLGNSGFLVSSIISAFSGMDAITINTTNLLNSGAIYEQLAIIVITLAAIANLFIKWIFAVLFGDKYFASKIRDVFLVDSIIGVIAMLLIVL